MCDQSFSWKRMQARRVFKFAYKKGKGGGSVVTLGQVLSLQLYLEGGPGGAR